MVPTTIEKIFNKGVKTFNVSETIKANVESVPEVEDSTYVYIFSGTTLLQKQLVWLVRNIGNSYKIYPLFPTLKKIKVYVNTSEKTFIKFKNIFNKTEKA